MFTAIVKITSAHQALRQDTTRGDDDEREKSVFTSDKDWNLLVDLVLLLNRGGGYGPPIGHADSCRRQIRLPRGDRMKPVPAIATVPDDFDPIAIAGPGHNQPPSASIFQEIEDLFEEAKNWADGEAISSQEIHDQIEKLRDGLHEAGKRADALRVEEKKPLDDAVKAIQDRYNPYIQPKKGKVDMAKATLDTLLTPWRTAKAAAAQAEAARVAAAAAEATRIATEAIRASSGNLAAREEAEEQLADAKRLEKTARRWDKAATTGTGLRTTYRADLVNIDEALDHYWATSQARFEDLVRELAAADVRAGKRTIPGFVVVEVKTAA